MAVLNLKPHTLDYQVAQPGYELENGDFVEGSKEWVSGCISCDAVPLNGKATEVKFEDGTTKVCSYVVYLDKNVREFFLGELVRIHLLGGAVKVGKVKGFVRYQMQCKLWV